MNEISLTHSPKRFAGRHLVFFALASITAGCGQEPMDAAPVVRPVKIMDISDLGGGRIQAYPGFIRAADSAEVSFEVPGRIIKLEVKEGQQVEAGDVLAALDDENYAAELDVAVANLNKARSDLTRSENIFAEDPGAITQERIDADRRAVEVSDARLVQARKSVDDTVLRAPFDGSVSRRLVEVFENVQAKQPVLIVEDLGRVEVEIAVPERDMAARRTTAPTSGKDLERITRRVSPIVTISALPDVELTGRLSEIATRADPTTRTFAVRIAFDAPEGSGLLPGMTARVSGRFETDDAVKVPLSALAANSGAEATVWIIDADTMTAHARVVELGEMGGEEVEIISGLMAGEKIAVTGAAQLAEGMQVSRFNSSP
ncbi:MAG: efflux RND transporter periplasmic adaptor subunit [Gammaproteobacteria bacterium]